MAAVNSVGTGNTTAIMKQTSSSSELDDVQVILILLFYCTQ